LACQLPASSAYRYSNTPSTTRKSSFGHGNGALGDKPFARHPRSSSVATDIYGQHSAPDVLKCGHGKVTSRAAPCDAYARPFLSPVQPSHTYRVGCIAPTKKKPGYRDGSRIYIYIYIPRTNGRYGIVQDIGDSSSDITRIQYSLLREFYPLILHRLTSPDRRRKVTVRLIIMVIHWLKNTRNSAVGVVKYTLISSLLAYMIPET
jgi:hypothetical protein